MPICKRANFEGAELSKANKNDTFHDNDEVFYCEVTKEIFRDYEDYFRHVMVINSTVWQCEATGRENLTYAEALKSEKRARKKMELFKESLRAPVMLVVDSAKQSSMKTLNVIVAKFLRKRYFLQELVSLVHKSNVEYKVIDILLPDESAASPNVVYDETENLNYKIQRVNSTGGDKNVLTVPFANVRRQRSEFTTESLQMFIKYNITRVDGILRPKPESFKKYVADHNITFKTIFIGKMPHFTPAKIKPQRPQNEEPKKQSTLNKYVTKNNDQTNSSTKTSKNTAQQKEKEKEKERAERAEQKAKSLKEQMEKLRLEKLEKIAQIEREKAEKRAKMMEKIGEQCDALLIKKDDLERNDQRMLPLYRPVKTYIDSELVGDAFMVREFMHSFCGLLSGVEVFRDNLNFYEMSRAFSVREVVGPLSDILLVLLGTIFDLQHEEEEECEVRYSTGPFNLQKVEPFASLTRASLTHAFVKQFFSFKINNLPIDALTLSEVLRLHLLSSGAPVREKSDKWRIMYRNGYSSIEDPGYQFVKEHPQVLHALSYYPVYQLSFKDIMRIVRCLMAQILTYSSPINLIEERLEQQYKIRNELKLILKNENRRLAGIQAQRQLLTNTHNQQCMDLKENIEEQKLHLEEKLNRKVADLLAQSEREHRKFQTQVEKINKQLFDHLLLLGMDRAYRKYYVLESMKGIFVEHAADCFDICLSNPPTNMLPKELKHVAANLPRNRRDLRNYLLRVYRDEEKSSMEAQKPALLDNKENQENHVMNGLLNGVKDDKPENEEEKPIICPTQTELYMCSGDPQNCIVHSENHSGRQMWSYIYEKEEIDALIESLNSLGDRESLLREQLTQSRELILDHVKKCPENLLSIVNMNKFKNEMLTDTYRKYSKSNYGLQEENDMNVIMHFALVERVLQFEADIYSGDLGRLKVKDMEKWRNDLLEDKYDAQCKLQWGSSVINGEKDSDIAEVGEENKELARLAFRFIPGEQLNISEEDCVKNETDLDLKKDTIEKLHANVHNLASALLQVEQAIERRFIKEPFGVEILNNKNKELLEQKQKEADEKIKRWEDSLMKSTSYSQVFLHLNILHDCIEWARSTNKSLCQICRRGSDPEKMLLCDVCNGGTHMFCMKPKMKTVPEGNWYCQRCINRLGLVNEVQKDKKPGKPKRKFIMDDADNSSDTSSLSSAVKDQKSDRLTRGRTRKSLPDNEIVDMLDEEDDEDDVENEDNDEEAVSGDNSEAEDDEAEPEENDEEDADSTQNETVENVEEEDVEDDSAGEGDEAVCSICSYDGSDLACVKCKASFHLECVHLRRRPRYIFICSSCRQNEQSKRKYKSEDNSSDEEEKTSSSSQEPLQPPPKRSRSTRASSLRGSGQFNDNNGDNSRTEASMKTTSNRRSSRRTGDDLPLNSAAIYRLLDDIMKDENAWPFLRPVSLAEVPDYHKVIKNPMDLAKVKSKLNMGEYRLNEEVMNDIQLVFKNCEKYNDEDNEVFVAGTALEKSVIKQCKSLHLPYIPSGLNK